MSKPEANYLWGNVDNTIQIIESRIDLINRTTDLYDPKLFSPDNDGCSQRSSHNIGEFLTMKKKIVFSLGLSPNVHPLMNFSLNWMDIYIQGRIIRSHFHHFKMNFYLHPKISPRKGIILSSQWKKGYMWLWSYMYYVQWFDVWWHNHG